MTQLLIDLERTNLYFASLKGGTLTSHTHVLLSDDGTLPSTATSLAQSHISQMEAKNLLSNSSERLIGKA